MNRVSRWIVILALPALCGCPATQDNADPSVEKPSDVLFREEQQKEQDHRLQLLENQMSDMARRYEQQLRESEAQRTRDEREYMATIESLGKLLEEKNSRIDKLERELEAAREARGAAPQEQTPAPTINVTTTPENTMPPPMPPTFSFPVRIFDVSGERIQTGAHSIRRAVQTDEYYRDDFGNKRPVIEWIEEEVPEYGYRVRFSAENLQSTNVAFSARAGVVTEDFDIAPGTTISNTSIKAALGSSLMVMSGGRSKSYRITYPLGR
jgi:hypothetical protein